MTTQFDRTTRPEVDPGERHTGTIELDAGWSSLRGLHGGYLAAIAVRFAEGHLVGHDVRTVLTSFLRPATVGPAQLSITAQRVSRGLTTHQVAISQGDRPVALTRITATTAVVADVPEHPERSWQEFARPQLPSPESCIAISPPPDFRHFDQATARIDPADVPFADGPVARIAGYVRPLEPRPIDAPWLTMILDWLPPSPFSRFGAPIGGVSVDYVVHVHAVRPVLADAEWLTAELRAAVSRRGLALERGRLFGPDGEVLAESFHTRWMR